MRTLKNRVGSGTIILILISVAVLMYFVGEGFNKTLGPFPDPVRYSWGSGKHCIVVYPDKREVLCGNFTKEELNEFRLEYANPHPTPRLRK